MIPVITDPLGKYWDQPSLDDIAIDDDVAMMTPKAFDELLDYSASIPSGKYAGKMWKACYRDGWYLRWYEDDPEDASSLFIRRRKIVVVAP